MPCTHITMRRGTDLDQRVLITERSHNNTSRNLVLKCFLSTIPVSITSMSVTSCKLLPFYLRNVECQNMLLCMEIFAKFKTWVNRPQLKAGALEWHTHPVLNLELHTHPVFNLDWHTRPVFDLESQTHPVFNLEWHTHPVFNLEWHTHPVLNLELHTHCF